MSKPTKPKRKRIGRPTKAPRPGERIALGLRVTPDMKRRLEDAAVKKGRSLSQEAEMRLEMSLSADKQLILAYGGTWLPVIRVGNDLMLALPLSWDFELEQLEEDLLPLKIAKNDLNRVRNFFTGGPPPYDISGAEYDEMIASHEITVAEQKQEARLAKQNREHKERLTELAKQGRRK